MRVRLLGATAFAVVSAAATMASAQPVPKSDAGVIEELVVTARRRAESVVDVPATATFMGGEELQARAVEDSRDLARTVPGLTVSNTGGQSNMNIVVRGQGGATAFRGNADGAVGLYEDGLYVGSSSFTRLSFFDLQRSEVLRGPQSAYFGRNALGGAINLVHQRPDLGAAGGSVTVGYGVSDTWTGDVVANLPVNDQLALRFGATYLDKNKGFFRNTRDPRTNVLGDRYLDHEDYWGGRLQALWKPSETFSALVRAEYFDEDSPGLGQFSYDLLTMACPQGVIQAQC
ncbi:TonB-dependent receptor plug domain-containing protein [Phenylobacterium sp. VNQ135]|uniref:TonB-dependent receptor plug domain-containing protein n=1 Tax=Phenylobacterium sp. VNQ135 TaxID=3400922 RepID=UPI003C07DDE8